MSDETLRNEVSNWLRQTGYVLEMEVARRLLTHPRRNGPYAYTISQGVNYLDPIEGKIRETDLTWNLGKTTSSQHSCRVLFVIECKNSSAPWVIFSGQGPNGEAYPIAKDTAVECKTCRKLGGYFFAACVEDSEYFPRSLAYNIVEKRNKDGKDLAREAVLSSVSAAISIVLTEIKEEGIHGELLAIPVVVTKSPIFVAQLDGDGEVNVRPTSFHKLSSRNAKSEESTMVNIITLEFLDEFIGKMCDMFESCWEKGTREISPAIDESKQ